MRHTDGAGRRLLVALSDGSPAFSRRSYSAAGGFGRRLLVALADATPAFRPLVDEPDTRREATTGHARTAHHGRSGHGPGKRPGGTPALRLGSDSAHRAALNDRAEGILRVEDLEELLSALRDAAPGSVHPFCRVETRHASLDLLATPEGVGFTVVVAITSSGHPARTSEVTIALEVKGEYFVAGLTPEGSVTFRDVPAGEWILSRIRGRDTPSGGMPGLALPLPRRQAGLAAAGSFEGTAVLKAVLPGDGTRLILHRERHGNYLIEVEKKVHTETLLAIAVRYGTVGAGEGFVVIPARRSGLANLARFSPTSPWQASQASTAQVVALGADSVASSVRTAANNVTRRAWREIGDTEPELRQVIARELDDLG